MAANMINIACVLRLGGEYQVDDVARLYEGVKANLKEPFRFLCFTDADEMPEGVEVVPLKHGWPGWFAKFELFRPDIKGDLLYIDLDTMVVGDIADFATFGQIGIMRDVYRANGLQSSMMFIPQKSKREIWQAFTADPDRHMSECRTPQKWGDQGFLEGYWLDKATRFQDVLPGQLVSYKAGNVAKHGVPSNCRAVIFHGKPRPRDINWKL